MNSSTRSSNGRAPEAAVSRRAQDRSRRSAARLLCVHRLIEAQAERTPQAVALSCAGESLTYDELNARANRLARRLRPWASALRSSWACASAARRRWWWGSWLC